MELSTSIVIIVVFQAFLGVTTTVGLRAQESPQCYEFICGGDPAYLCGSDNFTYLNPCVYSQAACRDPSLFVVAPGPCEDYDPSPTTTGASPDEFPVEISSTIMTTSTTTSEASITSNPEIVSSNPNPNCDQECDDRIWPVCSTENITYRNVCFFEIQKCKTPKIKIFKFEPCERQWKP